MSIFIVNTTTQLINASILSSTLFRNEKNIAFYTDRCIGHIENLVPDVFDEIYSLTDYTKYVDGNKTHRITAAIKYRSSEKYFISHIKNNTSIFISSKSIGLIQIYYIVKNIVPEIKLYLYEEGTFEYCELLTKPNFFEKVFSMLVYHRYYLNDCKGLFVHKPELIDNKLYPNIIPCEIPSLFNQRKLVQSLNISFNYKPEFYSIPRKSVILLDQGKEYVQEQKLICRNTQDCIGHERFYVKLHPRTSINTYSNEYKTISVDTPFELYFQDSELHGLCIVTINSSAAFNINILNEENIIIIYLFKIVPSHEKIVNELNNLIEKYNKDNSKKNVYIPSTIEEYLEIIKNL